MLCLITDRRRADVLEQARRAVDAGVDLIQIRERDMDARALAALVASVTAVAAGSTTRVVVNDRLDVALACGADGVHLRGDSIGVADARRLAPSGFLVGRSVRTAAEARASAGADYVVAGTVFPTSSKPEPNPLIGVDGLRAVVESSRVPVLAIGGITVSRFAAVAAAGAAGAAAIGLFAEGSLVEIVAAGRRIFDSPQAHP